MMMTSETVEEFSLRPITYEAIDHISRLFIQLRLSLSNAEEVNETSSPVVIFDQLKDVTHRLFDRKCYSTEESFFIFEKLLKNYLLLLDSDEFVDRILGKYAQANNEFLHAFYHCMKPWDLVTPINSTVSKVHVLLFTRLLDLLSSSTRILAFLQSEQLQNLPRILDTTCRIILIKVFFILNSTNMISLDLSVIKLKKYEKVFFGLLIPFIDKHFTHNQPSENDPLIREIFYFLYIISKEVSIISILINIDCPLACLQWLPLPYLKVEEYKYIMLILKNIVRHDDGILILYQHQCTKVLTDFTNKILYTKIDFIIHPSIFDELLFIEYIIFYSLIDPNTVDKTEQWDMICKSLLPTLNKAFATHSWICGDFYISELLIVLMKLFNNDRIVQYILQKPTVFEFFSQALKTCYHDIENPSFRIQHTEEILLSFIVLVNILWSISFDDQYKRCLIIHPYLIIRVQSYISSMGSSMTLSRQIFPFKRAIDGIRQNLNPSKPTNSGTTRSIMISYSNFDVDVYRKLHQFLVKNSKLSIHADADHWKQIAQNIEQSELILFLISKHFLTNKSCRQEFIYARDTLNKPCILVYIHRDLSTVDWLDRRIDRIQSIDVNEEEQLLSMIKDTLSTDTNFSDVKQWNDREVQQWFTNHHLLPELYQFYQFQNGNELFLYAQAILAYPWTKEYERIRSRFEKKFEEQEKNLSPHDFLKFIHALERFRHTSS